jgi:hypothetical protein
MVPISNQPPVCSPGNRRGVLLLIVLSMLTLFLMLGASYLVVAIRARKVSKAYADKVVNSSAVGANASRLVDEAFLVIARGTPNTTIGYVGAGPTGGDDLLGDKYGSAAGAAVGGRIQSASAYNASNAFISITTGNLTPALPTGSVSELPGRVFTLTLPGLSVSTRILRATGAAASPTIVIPAGITASGASLSLAEAQAAIARAAGLGGNHFRINGREFAGDPAVAADTNEPYDAFNSRNPLLTRIMPVPGGSPVVTQSLMNTTPVPLPAVPVSVDNDGDGQIDSQFLSLGLPTFTDASGATIEPRAAVLVVDLDGRINLNVHDSTVDADTTDPATGQSLYPPFLNTGEIAGDGIDNESNGVIDDVFVWTAPTTGLTLQSLPRGSSAGVASVSVRKADVLPPVAGSRPNGGAGSRKTTVQAGSRPLGGITNAKNQALSSDTVTTRPSPKIGGSEGRYGGSPAASNQPWDDANLASAALPRPGRGSARAGYVATEPYNDPANEDRERWDVALINDPDPNGRRPGNRIADNYFTNPGRYGTPPDLKDRMRVWIDPSSGQPVYYKPFWDEDGRTPGTPTITDNEVVDDPYEINLTRSGSRLNAARNPGTGGSKVDNPFTAADLEGLLRYFDPDSPRLSRRLVAIAGSDASQNRLKLTTESWDTPAVTDTAWEQVVRSPFSALLTAATPHDFFAPETIAGHKLDLNRPFHDTDFAEPYFDDSNSNGVYDVGEPRWGEQRRQQFAKHLYCLLIGIAARNGATLNAQTREQLAQYAVNVVDFRDADSIMTRFDYDANFAPGSTTWAPGATDYVWGYEKSPLMISETFAWHDRRTDDLSVGNYIESPNPATAIPAASADDDFDQQRRPRGAFFVELASLPAAKAMEFTGPLASGTVRDVASPAGSTSANNLLRADPLPKELLRTEDVNQNGALDSGEDGNSNGQIDVSPPANRATTTVRLDKKVPVDGSPVWRLVSIRGNVAFGTDPLVPATTNATRSILDPARSGGPAIDRAFYFVQPTPVLTAALPNRNFWLSTAPPIRLGGYTVVGTAAPFSFVPGGSPNPSLLTFADAAGRPGTLSEPLTSHATRDAYDMLGQGMGFTGYTGPVGGGSFSPADRPLDSAAAADFANAPDIIGQPLLTGANPLLMQNGTHDNFAVIHLQRLADPTRPWNANANPYITVDSMPVDLTVVNYDASNACYDEPGVSGGAPLAWLRTQKAFGQSSPLQAESVERGGKNPPTAGPELNLFNSRVNAAINSIRNADAFRTPAMANRTAQTPVPANPAADPVALVPTAVTMPPAAHTFTAQPDRAPPTATFPWLYFPNSPFTSSSDITKVPITSPFHSLKHYTLDTGLTPLFFHLAGFWESSPPLPLTPWDATTGRTSATAPSLLDFVAIPSRFAGLYATVPNTLANTAALTALGFNTYPVSQISNYREPGRINLNTIADPSAWRAMFGAVDVIGTISVSGTSDPDVNQAAPPPNLDRLPRWSEELFGPSRQQGGASPTPPVAAQASPALALRDFFRNMPAPPPASDPNQAPSRPTTARTGGFLDNNTAATDAHRNTDRNVYFRYRTMTDLMERTTTRSNVFAVWVTVGYFDVTNPAAPVEVSPIVRNRGFYIFDRSIPVAYERGQDHNVRDAVLLRRIIQ